MSAEQLDESPSPEVAEAEVPEGAAARTTGRSPWWMAASIILFAAAAALAIVSAALAGRLDEERNQRREVREVAGRFAVALLTYDYEDLDGAKRAVLRLSTGKFREEYEQVFPGLAELFRTTKARSSGTVTDVFVGEVERGSASAIVVYDVRGSGTSGPKQEFGAYLRLSLVEVGGSWKVDGVTNLNFARTAGAGSEAGPDGPSATTSPTTSPTAAPAVPGPAGPR